MDSKKNFRGVSLLALQIFVLWSLGVIILPFLGSSPAVASMVPQAITAIYLVLQLVAFIYTVYLSAVLLRARSSRTKKPRRVVWYALLYLYTLAALAFSIYLTLQSLPLRGS